MNEMQPEVHDSEMERDGCWCGMCGTYHSGDCPNDPEDDEELRAESAECLRRAATYLCFVAGLNDEDFPATDPDAQAVELLEDLAAKILCEDHEPDPSFWSVPVGYER